MFSAPTAECRTLRERAELPVQETSGSVAMAGSRSGVLRCATRRGYGPDSASSPALRRFIERG